MAAGGSRRPRAVRMIDRDTLQQVGELYREIDALADLFRPDAIGAARAQLVELAQKEFEILRHQLMTERRIRARARKIGIGHKRWHGGPG